MEPTIRADRPIERTAAEDNEPVTRGLDEIDRGEWLLSMSSWVIQDGNYSDFAVGERRRFALEFFDKTLREVEPGVRSAEALVEARHEITAEVVYARDDLVMLDFGLLAYSDARAPAAKTGTWRSGIVLLEVDHFAYFETHAKREGIPPAVYAWTITGIWRQTAPYILDPRLNMYVRDQARLGYAPLERTDAWHDDDGHAEYLFRCRLESDPPTFRP